MIRVSATVKTDIMCVISRGLHSVIAKYIVTNRMSRYFARRMREVNTGARD